MIKRIVSYMSGVSEESIPQTMLPPKNSPWSVHFDPSPHFKDSNFHCPNDSCLFVWPKEKQALFLRHLRAGHPNTLMCISCMKVFEKPSSIMQHLENRSRKCSLPLDLTLLKEAVKSISGGYLQVKGYNKDGTFKLVQGDPPSVGWFMRMMESRRDLSNL
jgi:hypothetical protein